MDIDNYVKKVEDRFNQALDVICYDPENSIKESTLKDRKIFDIDIACFVCYYRDSKYSQDRIYKLVRELAQIKFQFLVIEVDIIVIQSFLLKRDKGAMRNVENSFLYLTHITLLQSTIIKSRILFEYIMNFVYLLEKDEKLDMDSSKKKKFFKAIKGTKWSFLNDYKKFYEKYDDFYRTPEVHWGSRLYSKWLRSEHPDYNEIMSLYNNLKNVFWNNLKQILKGDEGAASYSSSSMNSLSDK